MSAWRAWLMFWACALGFHDWRQVRRRTWRQPELWECQWCAKRHRVKE